MRSAVYPSRIKIEVKVDTYIPKSLSKSRFIAGRQCEKRLWLEVHQPDLKDISGAEAIFAMGTEVGEVARHLYPEGVLIAAEPFEKALALNQTQEAVKRAARVVFEAAAEGAGGYCRADIMVKAGGKWDILEVKASGGHEDAKKEEAEVDTYLWDIAHQKVVFEAAGYPIRNTSLVLLNKDYVRKGALDLTSLFAIHSYNDEVNARVSEVKRLLVEFQGVLAKKSVPAKKIGTQCFDPYDCPFETYCWKDVPEYSVFNLKGIRKVKAFGYYHAGVTLPEEVPTSDLTAFQTRQVQVRQTGKSLIDSAPIKEFLDGLQYPLRHFDFETIQPAIPPFDGTHPFHRIPFQYSVHVEESIGRKIQHLEYLSDHLNDPRRELLDRLLADLGSKGTVLAYYASFERGVLKQLADEYPDYRTRIEALLPRIKDLADPFGKGWYIHPAFHGSFSLKFVLPALVKGMTYEGMAIGNGGDASAAYLEILNPRTTETRRKEIRRDLLAYCGQDTAGMPEILNRLRQAA
jgi:Domain of unknown function(DUF2779)